MSSDTVSVIDHHLEAFGAGDTDELITDYTDKSILITPERILSNINEIFALFNKFLTDVVPPGCDFELSKKIINGDIAYLIWSAESENYRIPFATDTFLIRNDKIATHTVAMVLESKN
ncbi:MAG: nuclear transport factor 2 family protein [Candidatus Dadabacteria bacterium]|nr:nuclear transport factor 2 family protein [Candidatus Dadabacteria bacterium]